MARRPYNPNSDSPFHITSRCHNREAFPLPLKDVWTILTNNLEFTRHAFGLTVYSFVLMPNHFHLLTAAPNQNLSQAMQYFLRESSRQINHDARKINQLWGNRFHRSEITRYHYFMNAYKYIYQNPLRARISSRVEDYRYSTLHAVLGNSRHSVLVEDTIVFNGLLRRNLQWLNTRPNAANEIAIKQALRRRTFQLPKYYKSPSPLETELL